MKSILYITELLPYPLISGGRIKTLETIKTLSKKYHLHLVCQVGQKEHLKQLNNIISKNVSIKCFYNPNINKDYGDYQLKVLWAFVQGLPLYVYRYKNKTMKRYIDHFIKKSKPDVIHIDHLNMAQFLPRKKNSPWVYEEHNLEYQLNYLRFLFAKKIKLKLYLFFESLISFFYELRQLSRFDYIFAISNVDKKKLQKTFKLSSPIFTFLPYYPIVSQKKLNKKSESILFIGNLNWEPNEDAVTWFCQEIFPAIKKKNPKAQFHVVGEMNKYLTPSLLKLPGVFFHGFQKNIDPFLEKAAVFVLPFRIGGGIRIKALTAIAHRIPLVATTLGIEGLQLCQNKNFLLANNASPFAKKVIKLISNKKLRNQISHSSQKYLLAHHGEKTKESFLETYNKIIQRSWK